ncbi:MAG TPA: hypothetical protein VFL49_10495 [Pseudolabrys sp.]|nr:hypothetical protein [Pseudolabrys sp.]
MPLFSYFVVMGLTLTAALLYISGHIEPLGSPFPASQMVGVEKPFKPEPERPAYTFTATNFAAASKPAADAYARADDTRKSVRRTDSQSRGGQSATAATETSRVPGWGRIAQNPIAALMSIH